MVVKRSTIIERLKELDIVVRELHQYDETTQADLQADLSRRWILERGLIAAATLILDIADHILSGHFSEYANTYEESLAGLQQHQVISDALYNQIKDLVAFATYWSTCINKLIHSRCLTVITKRSPFSPNSPQKS